MIFKRRHILLLILALIVILCSFKLLPTLPPNMFSIQQKPTPQPQKNYDYYIIVDEIDNHNLMYVPVIVNIGDEVISEENKRYKVVRIEQNRAFARFVENVTLEDYKK